MKKFLPAVAIALLAILAWRALDFGHAADLTMNWNGEEVDGPLGWLLGLLFAGGGVLFAFAALALAALFLGLLWAGIGVLLLAGMALFGLLLAALLAPVMLPLLIPLAILLVIAGRARRKPRSKS
ncbi:hypothetical protein [Janthinobacterium sp.]|uniref:hypothetical protein n=1 Tax=Janthinobacterium sp. TaxID=1871054 RepID=UPI00293D5927|nr:hypothetical protein [Janthinobacterium sp.]